jgi:class 3 adenylate cyclase
MDNRVEQIGSSWGERRQITAVFIDVVNFSALANLADAEDLDQWLEDYYRQMGAIVEAGGGEVSEYLGDGIIALFGAHHADELAATKAVDAALRAVAAGPPPFPGRGALMLRAGVATGEVVVRGETEQNMPPRTTGLVMTLAQRLQDRAEPGTVLVSETTRVLLRGALTLTPIENQRLKGFTEPMTLFRPERRHEARALPPQAVFIGRDAEFAALDDATGHRLIAGPPGIGKSALARRLAA